MRGSWVVTLLLVMTLVAGCGKGAKETRGGGGTTGQSYGESVRRQAVFFGDWQAQHFVPEEREFSTGVTLSGLVAELVQELLKGPTDPNLRRTIPAEVRLLEAKVEEGVAHVNLSKEFLNVRGTTAVQQAVGSLLLTLTDVGGIDSVQILVEGQKDVKPDQNVTLTEPMGRPFYGDVPYTPSPDRPRYLQEKVLKENEELWRAEAISVLRFEGRGFGFPAGRLEMADLFIADGVAQARVPYRGTTYLIELTRNPDGKEKGIWTISQITSHRVEAGAIELPLYFSDRQGINVIPEKRAMSEDSRGLATAVVEGLLAGPTDPYLVKLFPIGTRLLRPVAISAEGVAVVDLSGEVRKLSGSAETSRMVDALVYTLTDLPQVRQVQILIENERGAVLGNFKFDAPIGRDRISEQYHLDPDRIAWLQAWADKGQDGFRLDLVQTLMWEGRALGFEPDFLKTASIEQRADGALATLAYKGRPYVIEMGKNPGATGIWFIKGITAR